MAKLLRRCSALPPLSRDATSVPCGTLLLEHAGSGTAKVRARGMGARRSKSWQCCALDIRHRRGWMVRKKGINTEEGEGPQRATEKKGLQRFARSTILVS